MRYIASVQTKELWEKGEMHCGKVKNQILALICILTSHLGAVAFVYSTLHTVTVGDFIGQDSSSCQVFSTSSFQSTSF